MSQYILGEIDNEIERLEFQHRVWIPETQRLWDRAGFRPGDVILDAGCGPGFAACELAERVGTSGTVIAFDSSEEYLSHLRSRIDERELKNIEIVRGNLTEFGVSPATLDGVFLRMVMMFLPERKKILKQLHSSLKPGGTIALSEFHSYRSALIMSPPAPRLAEFLELKHRTFEAKGADLEVGRRLPGLLESVGFKVQGITPVIRVARPGAPHWEWVERFLHNYLPELERDGHVTANFMREFWDEWNARAANPQAYFTTPLFLNIVAKKI